jgi:hypothetical protein
MTYRGEVKNGVVVLEPGAQLSDGTIVQVEAIEAAPTTESSEPTSIADRLRKVIGAAEGLPHDLAAQHDHYLHGLPKR